MGTSRSKSNQESATRQGDAHDPADKHGVSESAQSSSIEAEPEGEAAPRGPQQQHGKRRKRVPYRAVLLVGVIAIGVGGGWLAIRGTGDGEAANSPRKSAGQENGKSPRGAGSAPGAGKKKGQPAKPMLVEVQAVGRGELAESLKLSGEVVATNSIVVGATKEGPITYCPWREGDSVEQGEKLVEIDREIHRAEVQTAEAALSVARAKLADLKAGARPEEIEKAEANLRRWEATRKHCEGEVARESRLLEHDAASLSSLETWREQLAVAEAELAATRETLQMLKAGPTQTEIAVQSAEVEEAAARLTLAKAHLAECIVTAPFDGVITNVHVRPGDVASPRDPLLEMYAPDSLVVRFAVSEAHGAAMRPGVSAKVTLDALPRQTFSAKITRVYPQLDAEMRTRTVEAKLTEQADIVPHMFARLDVQLQRATNAVLLPAASVMTAPSGADFIFVVEQGKVQRREIKIGLKQEKMVQAVSGIEPGERVVVAGQAALRDGQSVRVAGQGQPDGKSPKEGPAGGRELSGAKSGAGKSGAGSPSPTGKGGSR
ncbi:MAG: efflux RND transporter periplasmic adaptor subunit [Pirellulaceae bacterium]